MGASLTMIDRHYGHLARDGREHAIKLLDALNASEFNPWTLVDAAWTPNGRPAVSGGNRNNAKAG
jgi:hypothetical protein